MILTSCLVLALCTFQFSAEPCALEHDTDYYGNEDTTPDGRPKCSSTANEICAQRDPIPDVPSCQSYCNSSTYFTWKAPKEECFCKSSDSGRRQSEMDVSGKTNCVGERQVLWHPWQGLDCYQGHGGDPIHPDPLSDALSLSECKKACEVDNSCEGIVTQAGSEASGLCYKRRNLDLSKCVEDAKWNLFIKTGSPGGNHVGISVPSKRID